MQFIVGALAFLIAFGIVWAISKRIHQAGHNLVKKRVGENPENLRHQIWIHLGGPLINLLCVVPFITGFLLMHFLVMVPTGGVFGPPFLVYLVLMAGAPANFLMAVIYMIPIGEKSDGKRIRDAVREKRQAEEVKADTN
ncbi:MAG: hypothetical protein FWE21_10800 [Defluviitaleaceae bacterium]|nr:hypothetical protein [Defluviitaleaceae bacterium]